VRRSRIEKCCLDEFNQGALPYRIRNTKLTPERRNAIACRVILQTGEDNPTKFELQYVDFVYEKWCNPAFSRWIKETLIDFYSPQVKGKKPQESLKKRGRKKKKDQCDSDGDSDGNKDGDGDGGDDGRSNGNATAKDHDDSSQETA